MDREFAELIHGYFDEALTDEETRRLSDWIKEDPRNAEAFARAAMLHDRLQLEFAAATSGDPVEILRNELPGPTGAAPAVTFGEHGGSRRWWLLAALAASLLGIIGIAVRQQRDRPQGNEVVSDPFDANRFASIDRAVDVRWSTTERLAQGDRIGVGRVRFESGMVRLQFDDGVDVTLEGPADYELLGPGKTRLHAGLLSASVPPGAEGFRVDTPAARVVDLGTAFGVRVNESGVADILVFDGLVDVEPHESNEPQRLKEGEAVRVSSSQEIERADFDIRPFEKLWPVSSGIAGSTGSFRLAPPWPRRLRLVTSDDHIFVVPEGYLRRLPESLDVNVSEPGVCNQVAQLTPATIPRGQQVRSFLLHFRPQNGGRGSRIAGSITFDRPVLGLIVLQKELAASKKLFVPSGVEEVKVQRQLELRGGAGGDSVELSEDRKTVRLKLAVPNRFSDLVRVIVDATPRSPTSSDPN